MNKLLKYILVLSLLIMVGIGFQPKPTEEQQEIIDASEIIGKPLFAYKSGTTNEYIIPDQRKQLATVLKKNNDPEILAYVFFKKLLDASTVGTLFKDYHLQGGEDASVQIVYGPTDFPILWGETFPKTVNSPAAFIEYLNYLIENRDIDMGIEGYNIGSFAVWGRTSDFNRMWQENDELIRGIAVQGTRGHVVHTWIPVMPYDKVIR